RPRRPQQAARAGPNRVALLVDPGRRDVLQRGEAVHDGARAGADAGRRAVGGRRGPALVRLQRRLGAVAGNARHDVVPAAGSGRRGNEALGAVHGRPVSGDGRGCRARRVVRPGERANEGVALNVLVCVKRVPVTGGRIVLTEDEQEIDTRFLGFTVSPHEECAAEEAVRLVEAHGGSSAVLTLGPPEAEEQLRDAMAIGMDRGVHLQTGGEEWGGRGTAAAIAHAGRAQEAAGGPVDLVLFGREWGDAGGYQVGIRVAHALGRPIVIGVKQLEVGGGRVTARREAGGGWEVFEVPLPAVLAVKEGINLPRYPSMPGRLKAKKKPVEVVELSPPGNEPGKTRRRLPQGSDKKVEILGEGVDAVPAAVERLRAIGVV